MGIAIGQDLEAACVILQVTPQDVCVTLPGGAEVCAQMPGIPRDGGELSKQLLAQLNASMAPLTPIFNVIDAIIAVFACVQAIPEAILKLDVKGLVECVPEMVEKVAALAKLVPQISVPFMIVGMIDVLILALEGIQADLEAIAAQSVRIQQIETLAQEPRNVGLVAVLNCANADFQAFVDNVNAGAGPINRLIGLLNAFMQLIGLEGIPVVGTVDSNTSASIEALGTVISTMREIRNAIPI